METFWVVLLFPLAVVGGLIWRVIRRGYQMKSLAERGLPVTGEVVKKLRFRGSSTRGNNRFMRYRFRAGDGQYYSHKIAIGIDDYNKLEPGDPIELVYLPDDPKVSARIEMVEMVRETMEKRASKLS